MFANIFIFSHFSNVLIIICSLFNQKADGSTSRDFKTTKTLEQVTAAIVDFTEGFPLAIVSNVFIIL